MDRVANVVTEIVETAIVRMIVAAIDVATVVRAGPMVASVGHVPKVIVRAVRVGRDSRLRPNFRSARVPSASSLVHSIARRSSPIFPRISAPSPNSRCRECKQCVSV